ncbi:MAG: thioredoxin domain-containing protein [Cyanobacteria bacterium P01_F01_bin.86]
MHSEISRVIPSLNDSDHIQGSLCATLILMEYGDYQCFQSKQAHKLIKVIQKQLAEKFCFVFRHFPKGLRSQRIAESVEAAAAQDKFWDMHDLLLEQQQQLEDSDLVEYAVHLELDIPRFLREMAEHIHRTKVQADINSGRDNGVEDTPTFFIGVRHEGTQNLESLLLAIVQKNTFD